MSRMVVDLRQVYEIARRVAEGELTHDEADQVLEQLTYEDRDEDERGR